jgi:excisionase family DNA binding protein
MDRETLTVAEVATLFGIHPNSVYRAAKSGDLRTVRAPVRRVLFA